MKCDFIPQDDKYDRIYVQMQLRAIGAVTNVRWYETYRRIKQEMHRDFARLHEEVRDAIYIRNSSSITK